MVVPDARMALGGRLGRGREGGPPRRRRSERRPLPFLARGETNRRHVCSVVQTLPFHRLGLRPADAGV